MRINKSLLQIKATLTMILPLIIDTMVFVVKLEITILNRFTILNHGCLVMCLQMYLLQTQ